MSKTIELKVPGMTCGHCKMAVTNSLKELSEVDEVIVDLDTKLVTVKLNTGADVNDKLVAAIDDAGFDVE